LKEDGLLVSSFCYNVDWFDRLWNVHETFKDEEEEDEDAFDFDFDFDYDDQDYDGDYDDIASKIFHLLFFSFDPI